MDERRLLWIAFLVHACPCSGRRRWALDPTASTARTQERASIFASRSP
ncbi:Hypothetical protein CAP_2082 [Chondromyces apiculatus DSM 436]|uniref:Uncharacterized protein n=1 Tax=Chondromyces apiculatus DSM 436 TaxID=1192034 RepID=A0A017TAE5_9BACT|nr:Hypothetical protein CAP_2082 [Chondromyces apiculatus DSM 436]